MPPSSVALSEDSPPPSLPTGVRAAPRITVVGMGSDDSLRRWRSAQPRRRRATRTPTRSSSASSRARAFRTTSRTARSAPCVDSGEARPGFRKLAHAHAAGRRWILIGLGARDELRRRARADRGRRGARPGARAGRAHALLGAAAQGPATQSPARSSRARCSRPTATGTSRASADDERPPETLIVSAHHDVAASVEAGRAGARGGEPRARPRQRARPTRSRPRR